MAPMITPGISPARSNLIPPGILGFSPASVSGLQLWLDASDETTITESSGAVSQWDDKSGNSRHAVQGTGSAQPSTGVATINGINVIRFDGNDDLLTGTFGYGSMSEITGLIVGKYRSSGTDCMFQIGLFNDTFVMRTFSGGFNTRVDVGASAVQAGGGSPGTDPLLYEARYKANDEVATRKDGVDLDVVSSSLGAPDLASTQFSVGAQPSGTQVGDVDIAEIVLYDSILSTADREAVEAYLAAKWGITLS